MSQECQLIINVSFTVTIVLFLDLRIKPTWMTREKKQTKHELSLVSFCWKEWKVITTVVPMNENDILWSTSIGLVNFAKFVSLIVFIVCHLSCYVSIYVCEFAMFPIFSLALILYHHRRNKSALDFWFKNKQKHLIFLASA